MSDVVSILPPNASDFERNMEQTTARIGAVPVPLRDLWNPQTIPESLLPWLAWSVDVPFWDKNDSLKNKRAIVAASFDLHRRRGTLSCFTDMARWAGAELIRAITPPAKTFCAATTTQGERNQFLSRMPQLRMFQFRNQSTKQGAMNWKDFPVAASGRGMFPVQSTAGARLGVTAFIHADGVDTPLTTVERSSQNELKTGVSTQEVRQHASIGHGTVAGGFIHWLVKSTAASRLYTLRLLTPYIDRIETLHKRTVAPSMRAVDVHYDTVAQQGKRAGIFIGGSFMRTAFRKTHAGDRLYKRVYMFDPSKTLASRGMSTHLGGTRLSMRPHNAEIDVRINGVHSIRATGRFVSGFMLTAPRELYNETMAALGFARRASDRVLVQTAPRKIARTKTTILSGAMVAGQWI